MLQLIYVSTEAHPMADDDLAVLLRKAREKNERLGVTGLLLYRDGAFIQVIEGDDGAIRDLYATIAADERHQDVTVLSQTPIDEREFSEWQMGFHDISDESVRDLPGFSTFMEDDLVQQLRKLTANPSFAREALLKFKTSEIGTPSSNDPSSNE